MTTYKVRYGRVISTRDYESCRIELEEEFDSEAEPDHLKAVQKVAREVESIITLREKYPEKFI
jgi:hypothetical protein